MDPLGPYLAWPLNIFALPIHWWHSNEAVIKKLISCQFTRNCQLQKISKCVLGSLNTQISHILISCMIIDAWLFSSFSRILTSIVWINWTISLVYVGGWIEIDSDIKVRDEDWDEEIKSDMKRWTRMLSSIGSYLIRFYNLANLIDM